MAKTKTPENQTKLAEQTLSRDRWAVSKYLGSVKFAPRLMGVDAADVWKKIEKLCELYEDALTAERGRADKLERQLKVCKAKLKTYMAAEKKAEEEQPNG